MSAPRQLLLLAQSAPRDIARDGGRASAAARVRVSDPPTSKSAAKGMRVAQVEHVVLRALRDMAARGATTEELASATALAVVTVSPRMRPLERKGLVRDSGVRRANASGHSAIVWVAV